jgi:DNA-directed RNA polymerase subunit RPC12/RpoP
LVTKPQEKEKWECPRISGRILLKCIFKK